MFGALSSHESQLQGLISNFNTVTGALVSESGNLQRTIRLLGPTLAIASPRSATPTPPCPTYGPSRAT